MNMTGFIVLAIGGFLVLIALKGTQNAVLPGFFPNSSSSSSSSSSGSNPGTQPIVPSQNGTCPPGYVYYPAANKCVSTVGM